MFKILLGIAGILGFGIGLFGEAMKKLWAVAAAANIMTKGAEKTVDDWNWHIYDYVVLAG